MKPASPIRVAVLLLLSVVLAGLPAAGNKKGPPGRAGQRALEDKLLGSHRFGVQFIWDGYGQATISRTPDGLEIRGEQVGPAKGDREPDRVKIRGMIKVIDRRTIQVTGTLETFVRSCCGHKSLEGSFTFRKWGKRKFYRLQDPQRGQLCDKYTCHYYIDLFE